MSSISSASSSTTAARRESVEAAALDMVAQAPRRADDDVRACWRARVRARGSMPPTQVGDARAGLGVEPGQLALDLQRELARRRDDEASGAPRCGSARRRPADRRDGQAESDGLAGAGLGGDQNVAILGVGTQHGGLNGGRGFVMTLGERPRQLRRGFEEGQVLADLLSGRGAPLRVFFYYIRNHNAMPSP